MAAPKSGGWSLRVENGTGGIPDKACSPGERCPFCSAVLFALKGPRFGAIASLNVSLSSPPLKFRKAGGPQVVYRNGGVRFDPHMEHLDLYWQHLDDEEPRLERFDDLGFDHAYRQELGDFVHWVANESFKPCLTWEEGLRCVEVMEAAHRSADEGGRIISLPLYPELE